MDQPLDIREVARRTGLTSRALRFYEARGLLKPLRTYSGRRLYGCGELERIQQILALKRAGLTLAQIGKLTAQRTMDLRSIVEAQLNVIEERKAELDEARTLLLSIKSRIDRGEPVDAATFCSLIRNGDAIMEAENWKKVTERYFTPEEKAHWAARMPEGFDQQAYSRQWTDLSARIEAALPLDPASAEAQALLDEWQALLKPFTDVATPQMMAGASRLYRRLDEWKEEQKPPFSMEVWQLMQAAAAARRSGAADTTGTS
jgi:DNA-binding transcriptional MerR regulator